MLFAWFREQVAASHSLNWELECTKSLDGTSIVTEAVLA